MTRSRPISNKDHFQTILIFNKVDVLFIESEANLYQREQIIN